MMRLTGLMMLMLALVLSACASAPSTGTDANATAEGTSEATMEMTSEATMEMTSEATMEMTSEATMEMTEEATTEAMTGSTAEAGTQTIADVVANNPDFTTLLTALEATGLTETLQESGPFTVFAPNDAAFAKLPVDTLNALLADPNQLSNILLYHVVQGEAVASSDLSDGQMIPTVAGPDLEIGIDGNTVTINGTAQVISADINTTNGVIHVIDEVLLPPQQ